MLIDKQITFYLKPILLSAPFDGLRVRNRKSKIQNPKFFLYLCRNRGALNIQAEIKPIEPVRVMPERESENHSVFVVSPDISVTCLGTPIDVLARFIILNYAMGCLNITG